MYSIGIDSGSRMTKYCLLNIETLTLTDYIIETTNADYEAQVDSLIKKNLLKNKINNSQIKAIITTGYGRKNYSKANKYSSEIICHGKGINFYNQNVRTIIDIGGQDSKVIKIENGKVIDFVMNDKCAAGTGRFLEKVAEIFNLKVNDLGDLSLQSKQDTLISSTCVVFAESEIIGLISQGVKKEDIIAAVHKSVIHRILSMANSLKLELPIAFVGGVANNKGVIDAMNKYISSTLANGFKVFVPEIPDITGALGASLSF